MSIPLDLLVSNKLVVFSLKAIARLCICYRLKMTISFGDKKIQVPIRSYLDSDGWKLHLVKNMVRSASVFIDVGMNTGQTLVEWKLSGVDGRYFGFEPNHAAFDLVAEVVSLNRYSDCFLVPCGLSNCNSVKKLFLEKGVVYASAATIVEDLRPGRLYDVKFIPVYRFDDIVQDLNIDRLDFVKIDVEGAELQVLIGMKNSIQRHNPLILCEVLFADSKASWEDYMRRIAELEAFLKVVDYKIYQVMRDHHRIILRPLNEIPRAVWRKENANECDYIFTHTVLDSHICEISV